MPTLLYLEQNLLIDAAVFLNIFSELQHLFLNSFPDYYSPLHNFLGPGASLVELTDFIYAAQMAREEDAYLPEDVKVCFPVAVF